MEDSERVERVAVLVRHVDYGGNTETYVVDGFHPEIYSESPAVDPIDHETCYYLEHGSPIVAAGDLIILARSGQDHTWENWVDVGNHNKYDKKILWKIVTDSADNT